MAGNTYVVAGPAEAKRLEDVCMAGAQAFGFKTWIFQGASHCVIVEG